MLMSSLNFMYKQTDSNVMEDCSLVECGPKMSSDEMHSPHNTDL